ncbi:MAG: hypothetical protein A2X84_04035 [Desulfuromonadaceae bacterium GWC2_58_13]|nr:MAG: hypothetical protein A2X84_04035 [Desulfuromonadaceae bacterium GWC2_58_13]
MDWKPCLEEGETLRWEGRPAPRAFTFRNWKHSMCGLLLLLFSAYWQIVGVQLAAVYRIPWLIWIPVPFLIVGLYLGIGHLLLARMEWEKVFYAVTDRRLLAHRGLFRQRVETFDLSELTSFRVKPLGREVATLRVFSSGSGASLAFVAIEYPQQVTTLLEGALIANGHEVSVRPL